jgi:hypothetical protein
LNPGLIRRLGHLSAQCIDLFDKMAFAQPADSRVAGHITDLINVLGDEEGRVPHPGAGQGGLNPGMTSSYHNDIVIPPHRFFAFSFELSAKYLSEICNLFLLTSTGFYADATDIMAEVKGFGKVLQLFVTSEMIEILLVFLNRSCGANR